MAEQKRVRRMRKNNEFKSKFWQKNQKWRNWSEDYHKVGLSEKRRRIKNDSISGD